MPTPTAWLDLWFVASAILIWFMIAYQFALFVAGLIYSRRFSRRAATAPAGGWPGVSIVVPARNEARVIAQTIQALTALDYPADRIDITIVDDGSTDATPEIVAAMAATDSRIRCFRVPPGESGQGKASALNRVFPELKHDLIAIYDADNRPEPPSLRRLVAEMVQTPRLAAAVGKFRTLNRDRTLLTRFINIEGLAFQWIVQAGRCAMLGVTTLPGTNFVIRRTVLEEVGGWDREALTEDAELSIRIYETGRRIRFVPHAVTWEQEPERLGIWFKQRRRWARGHNYVLAKHLRRLLRLRPKLVAIELLYTLATYYVVFAAILVSDVLFVLGTLHLVTIHALGPYAEIWLLAFALFLLEVTIALSREKGEDSLVNLLLVVAGYFTYCQLWIPVVACAFADDMLRRRRIWIKTERFAEAGEQSKP